MHTRLSSSPLSLVVLALALMCGPMAAAWPARGRAMYECCCRETFGCDTVCFTCYNHQYVCNCGECSCYDTNDRR
jgi:hypothetical protein